MKFLNKNIVLLIAVLSVVFSFGVIITNAEDGVTETLPTVQKTQRIEAQRVKVNLETKRESADNLSDNLKDRRIETKTDIETKREYTNNSSDNLKDRKIDTRDKIKTTEKNRIQKSSDDIKVKEPGVEAKTNIQERLKQTIENREAKKAEREKKLNEKKKERIAAYTKKIILRLNAAVERMFKLADRTETRIIKLEEKFTDKELDLSEAKKLVKKAREEVKNAQREIESMSEIFAEAIDTENPKESFDTIREHIKNAIINVKNAHKTLVEAIKLIKANVVKDTTEDTVDTDTNDDDNI